MRKIPININLYWLFLYLSSLVEYRIRFPQGVDCPELQGDPVVLPEPHGVHRQESDLLVCSDVTCQEAPDVVLSGVPPAVHEVPVSQGQQLALHSRQGDRPHQTILVVEITQLR